MSKLKFGCVEHLRWIRKHMAPQDDEHKVKTCPWCGHEAKAKVVDGETLYNCLNIDCPTGHWTPLKVWNTRQIEDALNARIAKLEAERRWIPVSERLPEDGEVVWLWDGNNLGMGYYLVLSGCFMDRDTPLRRIKPTHWMPLPEPQEVK